MNTNLVGQDMALKAMHVPQQYIIEQKEIWRKRRDKIYNSFCGLGFDLWKPEGAFYIFPKCKNPREFLKTLFFDYKVIIYLGEWFGAPDRIRLSYALDESEIDKGLECIKDAMKKVPCL
jgi:aspartate/methionine/tyrosine aminotransferase